MGMFDNEIKVAESAKEFKEGMDNTIGSMFQANGNADMFLNMDAATLVMIQQSVSMLNAYSETIVRQSVALDKLLKEVDNLNDKIRWMDEKLGRLEQKNTTAK